MEILECFARHKILYSARSVIHIWELIRFERFEDEQIEHNTRFETNSIIKIIFFFPAKTY